MKNKSLINLQRELLIQLRSQLVGEKHVLPFTIYNDDTIEDLLKAQPKSIEELMQVKGFPKNGKRVTGFGELVVNIFLDPQAIQDIRVEQTPDGLSVHAKLTKLDVF